MSERPRPHSPGGIFDSLRALLETAVAILRNRAELVTTELEEEVARLVRIVVWAFAAVFAAMIGATLLGITILLVVPAEYRGATAAGLGVVFLVFAGFGYLAIRKLLGAKPRPFDASLGELEKDLDHLRREP